MYAIELHFYCRYDKNGDTINTIWELEAFGPVRAMQP